MTKENPEATPNQWEKPGKSPDISHVKDQTTSRVESWLETKKVVKSPAQILFEKIYTGRHATHSYLHEEHIIGMRYTIPSIDDGARIWFQDPIHYARIISKIVQAIFERDFNIKLYRNEKDILDWNFEEIFKSGDWLPDRRIVFRFKDAGGYIEILGNDALGWSMGQTTVHVNHDVYCKKGTKLVDIRKMSEWVDGIDIHGKRIHQFIGFGHGVDIQESSIKVWYFAEVDWFVRMKETDRKGMRVPRYVSISNNLLVWDLDNKILSKGTDPYNINIKAQGEISAWVHVLVTGNVRCKIMNYSEEITSTWWMISVLKEIRGTKIQWPFVSLRNGHHPTSLFWDNVISTNVLDLHNTVLRGGNTTVNVWFKLFEEKRKAREKLISLWNRIISQEMEFKRRVVEMLKGIKEDYTLMQELKKTSPDKKKAFTSSLVKIKSLLKPFDIRGIYDILDKLYRVDEIDPMHRYLMNYVDLFNIYEANKKAKEEMIKQEELLQAANENLKSSLFVNVVWKVVGDSTWIIINYGFKKKSIRIHEKGPVTLHMKYNPDTDELEDMVSKEVLESEMRGARKKLHWVSR